MAEQRQLAEILKNQQQQFASVVPFNKNQHQLLLMDFTTANNDLTDDILNSTTNFCSYVNAKLSAANATHGIGGYNENRTVYSRSKVFDDAEEPRRLHLGIDIWSEAGTPVFAALEGTVHSFAFNNNYGDYGATIILQHELEGFVFYTLYGHLALKDLVGLYEGKPVIKGKEIAHFGLPAENGHWPPHLHFQLIIDMEGMKGDYPGVCKVSEREKYLSNCPDADLILRMIAYGNSDDSLLER